MHHDLLNLEVIVVIVIANKPSLAHNGFYHFRQEAQEE